MLISIWPIFAEVVAADLCQRQLSAKSLPSRTGPMFWHYRVQLTRENADDGWRVCSPFPLRSNYGVYRQERYSCSTANIRNDQVAGGVMSAKISRTDITDNLQFKNKTSPTLPQRG